jgi:FixJ family two-component response regulator
MNGGLSASGAAPGRALNVAVIDDDDNVRRSLGRLLQAAGMIPSSYASAEQFLQYATQRLVDCVILDVHLRGMSGFDLHRLLVAGGSAPPVIFITVHDKAGIRAQARLARCAFFTKPVPSDSLLDAIEQATM